MIQIEVRTIFRHQGGIGETGAIVFCRKAGNIERRLDGFAQSLRRKVGGTGVTLALTGIHGDTHALVAIELDRFNFVATHAD